MHKAFALCSGDCGPRAAPLAIVPFAGAQEGPPQVGLRPDAPPYALHGPYWVGNRELVIRPNRNARCR